PNPTDFFLPDRRAVQPARHPQSLLWDHTHEDQTLIYYSQNGTNQTGENAVASASVGPSLAPL
ncbi:hypothetical protein GE09DRAFT_1093584, partial [Coniochaeta sp. 2T2.1]